MTATDMLLENNSRYSAAFVPAAAPKPSLRVAVVCCMDARVDVYSLLGLHAGEANVIRNAGGAVTEDVIRSLAVSQRELGTRSIVLIHHTHCGMQTITDDGFRAKVERETGLRPHWAAEAFSDVDAEARQALRQVRTSPFVPYRDDVRSFVFDIETGALREVVDA